MFQPHHSQPDMVLKVQPYLIVLIWSQLGYFLHILVLLGLFFGLGWGPKRFLTPINVDYQFWFWNYSPIFFFIRPNLGSFWTFLGPLELFWGRVQVPKRFFKPINVDYQFWFWNYNPIFCFHSVLFGAFLGPLGLFLGLGSGPKTFLGPTYIA